MYKTHGGSEPILPVQRVLRCTVTTGTVAPTAPVGLRGGILGSKKQQRGVVYRPIKRKTVAGLGLLLYSPEP